MGFLETPSKISPLTSSVPLQSVPVLVQSDALIEQSAQSRRLGIRCCQARARQCRMGCHIEWLAVLRASTTRSEWVQRRLLELTFSEEGQSGCHLQLWTLFLRQVEQESRLSTRPSDPRRCARPSWKKTYSSRVT